MRKIRDALKDSMDRGEYGIGFPFPYFIRSIAYLLFLDTHVRLLQDVPDVHIGNKTFKGAAVKDPGATDFLSVLNDTDLIRSTAQRTCLMLFIEWLLDQEETEADIDRGMWYDTANIVDKWNEFVNIQQKEADQ